MPPGVFLRLKMDDESTVTSESLSFRAVGIGGAGGMAPHIYTDYLTLSLPGGGCLCPHN